MRYWDSSAILALALAEPTGSVVRSLLDSDADIVTWWATRVECASGIARQERDEALDASTIALARRRVDGFASSWREVVPSDDVRDQALSLLAKHRLRAADALQLAAAILAAAGDRTSTAFVALDMRLRDAAAAEGFDILP